MSERLLASNAYWLRDAPARRQYPTLEGEHPTQVAVIGGGIAGLSTALELLQRGYQVTVCEASVIGAGTTAGSTGHLDAHPEHGPRKLVDQIGLEDARQLIQLRVGAIDAIERRCDESCDFVRLPAYLYSESPSDEEELREDCEAAAEIGLAARWAEALPLSLAACGYRMDEMARFHCSAYLRRLAQLVTEAGGQIFEHSMVEPPTGKHPDRLSTGSGQLRFQHVVSTVHSGYTDSLRVYLLIPPYQSYVLAARVDNPPADALYWDNASPYHYTRQATSGARDILLIGGCDHHTGAGDERKAQANLEEYAREHFEVREVLCRWSAEFFEPTDELPIIGREADSDNVWIATGFSGAGLTWGTAAGRLIADQIDGRETPLAERLSPSRFGTGKLGKMVSEQAVAAGSYAQRILPAEKIDPQALEPGEGRVGMVEGKHTAVCRDAEGCLHQRSPICTHMGGVVRWNPVEQTWDCPVHGGRYTADGHRLYGPPPSDLKAP